MTKTVDASLARRQLGRLLDEVYYQGQSIIIERKGKALAKMVPLTESTDQEEQNLLLELDRLPILETEEEPTDLLRKIRRYRSARHGS